MMRTPRQPRLRPDLMWIDPVTCSDCGLCHEVAPGMFGDPDRVPVTGSTLEAMSACPTGAIRWLEGEEEA